MVGSALVRLLKAQGYTNIITRSKTFLDLRHQKDTHNFIGTQKPDYVFLAAAKVGGILANANKPGEFIYDNLAIQNNVLHASMLFGVKKLLFLGSSCIYPKLSRIPIVEDELLNGKLEPTNEAYAIAKIAGLTTCKAFRQQYGVNFISVMPTNLYGPNDNYDLNTSHVLPALLRRIHEAKLENREKVIVWGTGNVRREFLHVDDCAAACIHLMNVYDDPGIVNIGYGSDITIKSLAELIADIVEYQGNIEFDPGKPDGTPSKLLDCSKIRNLGWEPRIELRDGVEQLYTEYKKTYE